MLSFKDTIKLKEADLDKKDINYISKFPSLHAAWEESKTSRWMLNYLKHLNILTHKQWVELALAFAERVLPVLEKKRPKDKRPREALNAVRAWLEDPSEKNKKRCKNAAYAATNALNNAANAAVAYAADAAANTVYAAYVAAQNNKLERLEQARIIRSKVPNPCIQEHERLGLDRDTAEPWKDILEEL